MILMNDESAIKFSLELAKALCESSESGLMANKDGATFLADFIETLQDRFTGKEPNTD